MTQTRIAYGPDESQFGVLWLPAGAVDPLPVVVLVHGGFWRAQYGLELMDPLAGDLVGRGFAVWNIEYRRVGQDGGGWPGTLADVGAAIDELAGVATTSPIDLARVAVVGHSAGGHLALWSAGRADLTPGTPGAAPRVVPAVVIGLGPVGDVLAAERDGLGGGAVTALLGGPADTYPDRAAAATPRIPRSTRAVVVRGGADDIVPARYTVPPDSSGIDVVDIPDEDHFDLIDPASASWAAVLEHLAAR